MSLVYSCNYCGQPIDDDDPMVTIDVRGETDTRPFVNGYLGHYHSRGEHSCYDRVREAMRFAEQVGGALDAIPVATNQKVAALRRRHRREG